MYTDTYIDIFFVSDTDQIGLNQPNLYINWVSFWMQFNNFIKIKLKNEADCRALTVKCANVANAINKQF